MAKETFMLVSLEEKKAKELAQLITNDTCRLILEYLGSKEEATESEIAKDLNLPISTVHYNIQNLLQHSLVESKEFMWSPKGKKMDIYKIARKLIVIVPKGEDTEQLKAKLKGLIPIALVSLAAAGLIQIAQKFFFGAVSGVSAKASLESAGTKDMLLASPALERAPETVQYTANYALWFLVGAAFVIAALCLYYLISSRIKKKS